jgi:Holliday junction resolvasome RuvABC endonuclease subunit
MITLALDLATKSGWALSTPDGITSGVWSLKPGRGNPHRSLWLNLMWYLSNMHQVHGLDIIAQEAPIVFPGRPSGARIAFGLSATVELFCEHKEIRRQVVSPAEIKKHATGKGNADKAMMVEAARKRWPDQTIKDDNQADSLWVLDWAINGVKT